MAGALNVSVWGTLLRKDEKVFTTMKCVGGMVKIILAQD